MSASRVRARDYVAYAVPAADATKNLVLEASKAGEGGIDDWSCQLLETAASLVTLLFEAERAARWHIGPRFELDGAGPLIGSSLVMQGLRERVERVATTDFTALIEGESGTGKELVPAKSTGSVGAGRDRSSPSIVRRWLRR